jgi:hypothetical protein
MIMNSNIFNGFLTSVSARCLSENQQYVLFTLLITNILLLIIFMNLLRNLARALHRKQPPVGREDSPSSPGGKHSGRALIKALPQSVTGLLNTLNERIRSTKSHDNSTDLEEPQKQEKSKWYCVGASVRGTSHDGVGLPCQDAHRFYHLSSGELIIAVADGVGSAPHSDEGAKIACDVAVEHISLYLKDTCSLTDDELEEVLRSAYQSAFNSIQERAEKEQVHIREYATTLTVAVITNELVVGAMVGDGMMVVEDIQGEFSCFFSLPKREYANQVVSITSAQGPKELQIVSRNAPVKTVSLLTDGLLRLSCDVRKNIPHAPFFQTMTSLLYTVPEQRQASNELQVLLNHPSINERTDDDKTLVVAANIQLGAGE